jgi:hypothetical protein
MSRASTRTVTADIGNDFGFKSADIHRARTVCELCHNGAFKFSVELDLLPELFLDACLRKAHAMGDVHRRADFVGGRR